MNCIDPAPTVPNAPDFKQIKRITGGVFRSDLFYSYLFRFQEKQRRSAALYQIARSTLPDLRQLVHTCILFLAPLTFTATFWTLEFQILLDLL